MFPLQLQGLKLVKFIVEKNCSKNFGSTKGKFDTLFESLVNYVWFQATLDENGMHVQMKNQLHFVAKHKIFLEINSVIAEKNSYFWAQFFCKVLGKFLTTVDKF